MAVRAPDWDDILDVEGKYPLHAQRVIFAELGIDWKSGGLKFGKDYGIVQKVTQPGQEISIDQCRNLAESYADGAKPVFLSGDDGVEIPYRLTPSGNRKLLTTPFDINPKYQSWLIIRLQRGKAQWQFANNARPVTVKRTPLLQPGDNCYLRHVFPSALNLPKQTYADDVLHDGCDVAFFGIAARRKGEAQRFNFHTEFVQPNPKPNKPDHHMVVIFDPDIPDDGGQALP